MIIIAAQVAKQRRGVSVEYVATVYVVCIIQLYHSGGAGNVMVDEHIAGEVAAAVVMNHYSAAGIDTDVVCNARVGKITSLYYATSVLGAGRVHGVVDD